MNRKFSYVSMYLNRFFKKQKDIENTRLIFRGHSNSSWNVVSSAGRRLREEIKSRCDNNESEVNVSQSDFIRYHVNLLSNVRKHGYGGISQNS